MTKSPLRKEGRLCLNGFLFNEKALQAHSHDDAASKSREANSFDAGAKRTQS
jgi:hypothetical protein